MPQRAARTSSRKLDDRIKGAMLGLAIGDALGMPALFLTPVEIRKRFGPRGISGFVGSEYHPEGTVSDDTQTALAVARATVDTGDLGVDALGLASAAELVRWFRGANLDRGPDATVIRGINRLEEGIPWRGSGDPGSKSPGALTRAVPIGISWAGQPDLVTEMAKAACFPTHAHPVAVTAFEAVALLVSFALSDTPRANWMRQLSRRLGELAPEVPEKLRVAFRKRRSSPTRVLPELGEGWTADEVVARAVFAALHFGDDFERAVLLVCNSTGDTAATGALVGALVGAVNGASAIPRGWRDRVDEAARIRELSGELSRMARRSLTG